MATYKKSGNKARGTKREVQSIEQKSTTAEVFNTLDETASRSEAWVIKNQQKLFIVLGIVVVSALGYLGYQKYIGEPNEKIAADELAFPKKHFNQAIASSVASDSLYILGLEGTDGKFGFVDVSEQYSGTDAGNLANYYAGISYLNIKDYENAIEYLDKFSSGDEALGALAKGAMGDAFADLNQPEDALNYYEQAAKINDNEFITPIYLFKAGNTALDLGKNDKALTMFKRIQIEYPNSQEAQSIDIYISKAKYAE